MIFRQTETNVMFCLFIIYYELLIISWVKIAFLETCWLRYLSYIGSENTVDSRYLELAYLE